MSEKSSDHYLAIVGLYDRTVIVEGKIEEVLEGVGKVIEGPRVYYPKKVWADEVRVYRAEEVDLKTVIGDHPLGEALYKAQEPDKA